MFLDRIIIVNYRSCQLIDLQLNHSEPNIFIGINDCGKSTILKAIELLLNPKGQFNFIQDDNVKNDLSNSRLERKDFERFLTKNYMNGLEYNEDRAFIIGEFQVEHGDLIEFGEDGFSNHMAWVLENNENGNILYAKEFLETDNSIHEYLVTPDYLNEKGELARLYDVKDTVLRSIIKKEAISDEEIKNENQKGRYKKLELFRAIYARHEVELFWSKYTERAKEPVFPECRYLDWNLSFDQLMNVATDVIKSKIGAQISAAEVAAKKEAQSAQEIVNAELAEFTKQFGEDLPNVIGFKANVNLQVKSQLTDLLINKANADGDIHLDQQGEGVKRQIWFALIKWKALSNIRNEIKHIKYIWCFDEPETHLYPKAQREFFEIIKQITTGNIQTLISTHSTVFIDRAKVETIKRIELKNGYSSISKCDSITKIYDALQIRNSDFLFFDKFLVVEGDTEEFLFPMIYQGLHNESLIEAGIQIINLGGKNKRAENRRILNNILVDFNKRDNQVYYVFDNDVSFGDLTKKELNEINPILLGKQDFEDSFSSEFWHRIITNKFPELDVPLAEIQELHNNIPYDKPIQSNQKFYPKLKSLLRRKVDDKHRHLINDRLGDKGKQSAELMYSFLDLDKDVDEKLVTLFKAIKN